MKMKSVIKNAVSLKPGWFFYKALALTVCLLLCLKFYAADKQLVTIYLQKAGTLPTLIPFNKKYEITNLRLAGYLDGTDIRYICQMVGRDYRKGYNEGALSTFELDLSDTKIVKGGEYYYYECKTSDNTIGRYMFRDCSKLTSIILPNGITSIGESAFRGCAGLTSITIPDKVVSIGEYAFYDCTGLTSIAISENVTSIGNMAFHYCIGLTSVVIPDNVTSVGEAVFYNCSALTSVAISRNITIIPNSLFYRCAGLTSITIPDGVTAIGDWAFYGCVGLSSITIPDNVTSIGREAFGDCVNLKEVHSCNPVPPFCTGSTFKGGSILYVPVGSAKAYKNASGWKNFENIVEKNK